MAFPAMKSMLGYRVEYRWTRTGDVCGRAEKRKGEIAAHDADEISTLLRRCYTKRSVLGCAPGEHSHAMHQASSPLAYSRRADPTF
jgi:hypothetical protein